MVLGINKTKTHSNSWECTLLAGLGIRSGRSWQEWPSANCSVALNKRPTGRDLLLSLFLKEQPWAIGSGRSWQKNNGSDLLFFTSESLFLSSETLFITSESLYRTVKKKKKIIKCALLKESLNQSFPKKRYRKNISRCEIHEKWAFCGDIFLKRWFFPVLKGLMTPPLIWSRPSFLTFF